ncbi:MAG: adenylate/guanylate cyclase domain-containing protein [Deltaproteobacteria bacterium]|nr:adenylate/guanylate cyclase domain-containing protein [Deltaproteobacteria bacterium]
MSQPERTALRSSQNIERRLAAILSADVKGYSRLMGADEEATLRTLTAHRHVMDTLIAQHWGRIVGTAGDSVLAEFASVVEAVQCAVVIQQTLKAENAHLLAERQMEFRIGINIGDVMVDGEQIYGDGVNIAARLEALAEAGGICISGIVHEQIKTKFDLHYDDLGEQEVKNIAEPVRTWRVVMDEAAVALAEQLVLRQTQSEVRSPASPKSRVGFAHRSWIVATGAGLAFIIGMVVTVRHFSRPLLSTQDSALRTETAPAALPLPDKPSIVVLPFVNMSGDPEQEYFSDGITEDLTSALSRLSGLFVISRNTAFFYKGKAAKMPELSKELGVQYVLEGSVRKADGQVRITTQLIDATQDRHLWSERYDRPLHDIFTLQDEIVQKMVTTLKLQLALWEQGLLVRKATDNLEAYDAFLRGQESWFRAYYEANKDANAQARQMFERAIELDPRYAEAYVQLGFTYYAEWFYNWNHTPQTLARAGELAQQAVTLDESLPAPHVILSVVYLWQKQHDLAIHEGERAIALDPNGAEGYANLGGILAWAGRPEEGVEMVKRAMRLNPHYPVNYHLILAFTDRLAGQYEEAIAAAKKALARQPNFAPCYFALAFSYAQLDRLEEARAAGAELQRLVPNFSLEGWKQMAAFKDPALLERDLAALRKAGFK